MYGVLVLFFPVIAYVYVHKNLRFSRHLHVGDAFVI